MPIQRHRPGSGGLRVERVKDTPYRKLEIPPPSSFNQHDNNDASENRPDRLSADAQLTLRPMIAQHEALSHGNPIETHMVRFV